jgi:hypothetical protein
MPDRVLILANEFIPDAARSLPPEIRSRASQDHDVLVVAPIAPTRVQSLCSDIDKASRVARERLTRIAADISQYRTPPKTMLGDENQLLAIEDALWDFDANACVVVIHAAGAQYHKERAVPKRIRERFGLPTTVILIDPAGAVAGHYTEPGEH